ncbi:HDOD domain-containing protein [Thiomicrorhabdus immobilis]|uniref:HDOD domain-containing protein n=1 Tax=Thiomicrorhabdus immobilis TaxID=2791037 RepID=A0ABM7MED0_9GAMM|nr:HDOD domain-containing protein [Thiomicrorhabdus immobilis]BCN93765.1 HDOD domain-containing protein [Thiomicrorhabdus immobilis]
MQQKFRNAMQAIHGQKIPELPDEILLLEKEITSKFASIVTVAEIIEKNATLSGEVLRIVNSPVVKLREPVKSIRDAVNVLGLDNIYNLVVAAAVQNLFGGKGLLKDIMDYSVDVAFCMADISEWVAGVSRDEAYMLGLFHNIGAMMLASKDEAQYDTLFRSSMSLPISALKKEEAVYGSNHAIIGVLIGKKWHLSTEMLNAIMLHHNEKCERIQNENVRAMVAMIKVACGIVSEISLGAYRGGEMRAYEHDGMQELMLEEGVVKEIRTALMSYTFKD